MDKDIVPLVAGNWKMNGLSTSLGEVSTLMDLVAQGPAPRARIAICPPATLLSALSAHLKGGEILTGGQDCHPEAKGAFTGDISAPMLADAGAHFVIVGHSERRAGHGETSELIRRKAEAALSAGLVPIICIGESAAERDSGEAEAVVLDQLDQSLPRAAGADIVVAYEPVWAIGTGRTPTLEEIRAMHGAVRATLVRRMGEGGGRVPILYGGSVKPSNAREILALADVNGALVGGASLLASDFWGIISSA
jgi:triosephosphate isomerase